MATDETFGRKLELLERAIGFRFPASAFSNDALALLLSTTKETMSRKKSGKANVTDRDLSVLTHHFGLSRHGFEAGMFADPLPRFEQHMKRVEKNALDEELIDVDRKLLFDLARGQNRTIHFELRDSRRGGIGAVKPQPSMPRLRESDEVRIRLAVPGDGHLLVVNDDGRRQVTVLMPSRFAPRIAVKAGAVHVPTDEIYKYFPVAGPEGRYRLIAVWLPEPPPLAFLDRNMDSEPCDLAGDEFRQLAGIVRAAEAAGRPFMVAVGDYRVVAD